MIFCSPLHCLFRSSVYFILYYFTWIPYLHLPPKMVLSIVIINIVLWCSQKDSFYFIFDKQLTSGGFNHGPQTAFSKIIPQRFLLE